MQKSIALVTSFISSLLFQVRPSEKITEGLTVQGLQSIARYDGTLPYTDKRVRALVWEVKYYAHSRAAQVAGEYLADVLLAECAEVLGKPVLIPMPMHNNRRRERGHNQTEVLCLAALPYTQNSFDYEPNIVKRVRHTAPQQGLERHERLHNVKNSMEVVLGSGLAGRVCLVVDDVTTTGASFAEAKRALKAAGAREVLCVALAQS
jgi:competence protein ComFC